MPRYSRDEMAARVARDLPEGAYLNVGIGLPTMVANRLPKGREILLQSKNGLLAMGPAPTPGGLAVVEIVDGLSPDELTQRTGVPLRHASAH